MNYLSKIFPINTVVYCRDEKEAIDLLKILTIDGRFKSVNHWRQNRNIDYIPFSTSGYYRIDTLGMLHEIEFENNKNLFYPFQFKYFKRILNHYIS